MATVQPRHSIDPEDELGRMAQTINDMLARLEHSFAEIRRFTADASHELRTPLAVLRTEVEVAMGKAMNESQQHNLLSSVLEECQRLTTLTDPLLTLSRDDTGTAHYARESIEITSKSGQGTTFTVRLPINQAHGTDYCYRFCYIPQQKLFKPELILDSSSLPHSKFCSPPSLQ